MSSYDYKSRSSSVLQKETIREMLLPCIVLSYYRGPDGYVSVMYDMCSSVS